MKNTAPVLRNWAGLIKVKDFTLAYVISKNYLSEKKLDKLLHEDIYLCFKAYPVRQAIVIRGIDG